MTHEQEVAAAWLAGIRHVATCPGCSACQLFPPLAPPNPNPKQADDEQTLSVSVVKS